MVRSWLVVTCLVVLGCGDEASPPTPEVSAPAPSHAPADNAEAPADPALGLPGEIYKRAYDQAQKEVTVDNAYERLKSLEREIDADRQRER